MSEKDLHQKSVLILECDKDLANSIKTYLEDSFTVYGTCDPMAIDTLISKHQIDLLLTGIDFPRANLKSIIERARLSHPKIKIIVMYMFFDTDKWTEKLILNDADDYIAKPFDADVLKHKLERLAISNEPFCINKRAIH